MNIDIEVKIKYNDREQFLSRPFNDRELAKSIFKCIDIKEGINIHMVTSIDYSDAAPNNQRGKPFI